MATNNLSWGIGSYGPTITAQEVHSGKKKVVTGNPDAGTGWTAYGGNPLANNATSAVITAIVQNVKYRFLHRTINTPVGGSPQNCPFTEQEDIMYNCGTLTKDSLIAGVMTYTHAAPASITDAGSEIDSVEIILIGSDAGNDTTTFIKKVFTPAAAVTGSTDTFNDVIGNKSWTLFKRFLDNSGNILQDCNIVTFTTTAAGGNRIMYFRNGFYSAAITSILVENVNPPTVEKLLAAYNPLVAGNAFAYDATALGATTQYIKVGLSGMTNGTQLYAVHRRAGVALISNLFTYNGPSTLIFPTAIEFQGGDIVEFFQASRKDFLPFQIFVTKTAIPSNGYYLNVQIAFVRPENNYFDVTFTAVNNNGGIETYTVTVTVLAGQTFSGLVFQASSFTPLQYAKTTIARSCVTPQDALMEIPITLKC